MQTPSNIELWKFKHLLNQIEQAKGQGNTSMITLFLAPSDTPQKAIHSLNEELSSARRIKSCI
jgi:peptide subunit release factor 1 (eRF1)